MKEHDQAVHPRLELCGISKQYPAVLANDNIDLTVLPGEIHAVVGENGAGKSTLMKVIFGVIQADAGEMFWEGRQVRIGSPGMARRLGIGMVFQHFSLFETLSVVENIALGLEGRPNLADLTAQIAEVSETYGLPVDSRSVVHSLSVGERQRVEIIRALLLKPRLLIMDEPTSVLTPDAVRKLFKTLEQLASEGVSILYISHKLEEIQELCTAATVLRKGRVAGHADPRRETSASLARLMIGKELPVCTSESLTDRGSVQLALNRLNLPKADPFGTDLKDLSLEVCSGEIVGIAGISGNGQKELLAALSGKRLTEADAVHLRGRPVGRLGIAARRDMGLAFVPEERLGCGSVPDLSLKENALLTAHRKSMVRWGLVDFGTADAYASRCIDQFNVVCPGVQAPANSLSGGNIQKFILAREIMLNPRVLILAQPTWGVDVNAAATIHKATIDLRDNGTAVLIVSEDLDELFQLCDRICVIANGQISPLKEICDTNREEVGMYMGGIDLGAACKAVE